MIISLYIYVQKFTPISTLLSIPAWSFHVDWMHISYLIQQQKPELTKTQMRGRNPAFCSPHLCRWHNLVISLKGKTHSFDSFLSFHTPQPVDSSSQVNHSYVHLSPG